MKWCCILSLTLVFNPWVFQASIVSAQDISEQPPSLEHSLSRLKQLLGDLGTIYNGIDNGQKIAREFKQVSISVHREAPSDGFERATPATSLESELPQSREACELALQEGGAQFQYLEQPLSVVALPVWLKALSPRLKIQTKASKPNEIMDCRLAVTLIRVAPILERHGIISIEHLSAFRENARVKQTQRLSAHAMGLALDIAVFMRADGSKLVVERDWGPIQRGQPPCGAEDSSAPFNPLRGLVCDVIEQGLFQVVITPNHDRDHRNHIHFELRSGVNWTYIR